MPRIVTAARVAAAETERQLRAEARVAPREGARRCDASRAPGTRLAIETRWEEEDSMKRTLATTAGLALAALAALASPAGAIPITPAAFTGYTVVESFEGVPVGPNAPIGMGASLLLPGTVSAFAFDSGVVLTSPIPNPGVLNQGPFLHDFARGNGVTNNWGATGVVNDPTDVPFGDAYLGAFHPSTGTVSFTLSFSNPMDRVGAYATGVAGSTITMRVYDGSGALLESASVSAVPLASWGTNFLGIEQPGRIARVVFSGADFGIDAFTFEDTPVLVPEPGTLQAVILGLLGLWGLATIGRERGPRSAGFALTRSARTVRARAAARP
jgi:hypothetical protein